MVVVLWQNWGEHVGRQLPHFLSAATLTDLTITVGQRCLRAHRIVLAFFSPFFKKMLEEVQEERPMVVVFPGVNFDALQVIVAYMYRGQVNVPTELLSHVIDLAKMLQVKGLIELPTQLDSVISGSKLEAGACMTSHITHGDKELGLEEEAEGLVELEVTEGEPHPTVCTTSSTTINNVHHTTTTTTTDSPPPSPPPQNITAGKMCEGTVEPELSIVPEDLPPTQQHNHQPEDVQQPPEVIQPEDIQLSTVDDDLATTHIVKVNADGSMGDVLFGSGGYISVNPPTSSSSSSQDNTQADQEETGNNNNNNNKKKARLVYKLARYGPGELQGALEDVRSGTGTLREIAGRWGVPHSTLSVNARLAGIAHHQRSPDYDHTTLQAAKEAVRAGGSYMKVARQYNIPKSVLWRRCQREIGTRRTGVGVGGGGAVPAGGGVGSGATTTYTTRELTVAREMLLEGGSLSHVVRQTKIPKTTVFRVKEGLVREGRLPSSSIARLSQPRRPSEESLRRAMAACQDQGLSHGKASHKFQVSKSTVWRRLKRLKQEDPEGNLSAMEPKQQQRQQQRVKIEVVESASETLETDTYPTEITVGYSEDHAGLSYVGHMVEEDDHTPEKSYMAQGKFEKGFEAGKKFDKGYMSEEKFEKVIMADDKFEKDCAAQVKFEKGYIDDRKLSRPCGNDGTPCGGDSADRGSRIGSKVDVVDLQGRNIHEKINIRDAQGGNVEKKTSIAGLKGRNVQKIGIIDIQKAGTSKRIEVVQVSSPSKTNSKVEVVAESSVEGPGDVVMTGPSDEQLGGLLEGSGALGEGNNKEEVQGDEEHSTHRFQLEMPLMNLPGGGYQMVGSEIVIGGQQQVVVLEQDHHSQHLS